MRPSKAMFFPTTLALSALLASTPALADVSAEMEIRGSDSVNYFSSSAAPNVLNASGGTATLQFSATSGCSGLACTIDGPAVSASIATGSGATVSSTARYTLTVTGASADVPILVSGRYDVFNPLQFPEDLGGTIATGVVDIRANGRLLFGFQSSCYDFPEVSHEFAPQQNCGAGLFSGSFLAAAGTDLNVVLSASAFRLIGDPAPAGASAFIDPYFQIDPSWAATHPGYALSFDPGVGNGNPRRHGHRLAGPRAADLGADGGWPARDGEAWALEPEARSSLSAFDEKRDKRAGTARAGRRAGRSGVSRESVTSPTPCRFT